MLIDDCIGLHEELRVIYVVDGYHAELNTSDGNTVIEEHKDDTVDQAIRGLETKLRARSVFNYRDVRNSIRTIKTGGTL